MYSTALLGKKKVIYSTALLEKKLFTLQLHWVKKVIYSTALLEESDLLYSFIG